mgnify:FL=1
MCEKYDIDDKTRFLVLYFDAHMDGKEISKRINRSWKTVRCWVAKAKKGEDIRIPKSRSGRPKSITEEIENTIIQILKTNPEGTSTSKLAARLGVCPKSIARVLAKNGYKYMALKNCAQYDEDERMIRMDFCKKMLSDEGKLIYRTFFSDEMGSELNQGHKNRVWQIPTEKINRKILTENVKLDCWGAISAQGATSLEIYKKGMNGERYRKIIERHKAEMERLYPDGEFYFLQDSHPTHRMNEEWLMNEQKLELIKLPKRSPDLNIIESLWIALKERVASDAPTNEKELRASLLNNWEILTSPERIRPFFEGLHGRYLGCVAKEGQKISY